MVAELTTNDYLIEDLTYDWREGIGEGERLREIRREGDTEGGECDGVFLPLSRCYYSISTISLLSFWIQWVGWWMAHMYR